MSDRMRTNFEALTQRLFDRPMRLIDFAFTDIVSRKPVNYYEGRDGRVWMATHRWARFRVPVKIDPRGYL